MTNNNNLDLSRLSDRVLIALQFGLTTLWEIEIRERDNAFYPETGGTSTSDLDLVDLINEELYERGNGGHRFCNRHLLPLLSPDYCEGCTEYHVNNNNEEN